MLNLGRIDVFYVTRIKENNYVEHKKPQDGTSDSVQDQLKWRIKSTWVIIIIIIMIIF